MLKRSLWIALLAALAWTTPASAQVTITYTFTNGTTADADQVNANFNALATAALNRAGGTITGNIAVNAGVTIDGVDISAALGGTGTPTFASLTLTGGLTAGSGVVGIINSAGKIPALSSTYIADLSGASLTSLSADALASGSLPNARLSGTYSNPVTLSSSFNSFTGVGTGLTSLAAANMTGSHTLPDGVLSTNVPLINAATNTFTGAMRFGTSQVMSWVSKSADTVYQAASDGFVTVWLDAISGGGGSGTAIAYTDGSNPPTTPREESGVTNGHASLMFPVRKGDFYKVTSGVLSGSVSYTIFWVPLGTAG